MIAVFGDMIEQLLLSITPPALHPVPPANEGLYLIADDGLQNASSNNSSSMFGRGPFFLRKDKYVSEA
jgi:hypothetical protein